ncbi:MAG: ABC transporter substrate-binding protein [Alphaproteobacteria bacterium]
MTRTTGNTLARLLLALAVAAFALFGAVSSRAAEAPTPDPAVAPVQAFCDGLLDTMKRAKELGLKGRYEALKPVLEKVFNLPQMTQIAVGPTWSTISAADQKALITAFERMTVANYANNFDGYSGEKFVVDPNVVTRKDDKLVSTKLVSTDDTSTTFIYRMRLASDGNWKVIDILLEGYVSEMAQRRSDFASTITTQGPAGLIKKINELADKQLKG